MELTGNGGYEGDWWKKRPLRMPYIERSRWGEGYGLGSHCPIFGIAVLGAVKGTRPLTPPARCDQELLRQCSLAVGLLLMEEPGTRCKN